MSQHAMVRVGQYWVPLVDIPPSATTYHCDGCKREFDEPRFLRLNWAGLGFYCAVCRITKLEEVLEVMRA